MDEDVLRLKVVNITLYMKKYIVKYIVVVSYGKSATQHMNFGIGH